jgi:Tol biopolymer transport system component
MAAMLLALSGAVPAGAVPTDGLIVFESDRGGQLDLWTMRSDGSGAAKLTDDEVADVFPETSPSGKKIAWTHGDAASERGIWVMNADGSGRQVTFNTFSDQDVVWSPDSRQLAYRSIRGGNFDIYVINTDGTGERRLTTDAAVDFAPDWSPGGTRIAFTSDRSGASAVYTMPAADGSEVRKLTPDSMNAGIARYSPDGSQIIFVDERCSTCTVQSDVWVMNTDGSRMRRVTNSAENETTEAWSHDGTRLVVDLAKLIAGGADLGKSDVAVVTVATGATVNLTNTGGANELPLRLAAVNGLKGTMGWAGGEGGRTSARTCFSTRSAHHPGVRAPSRPCAGAMQGR